MKKYLLLLCALALVAAGCGSKPAANAPANTATNNQPIRQLLPAVPPRKLRRKAPSTNPVPADWIRMHDDVKGYEFMVPQGYQGCAGDQGWRRCLHGQVPAPYDVAVMVVAFKDKDASKEELLKRAENV
jgi:hypothetical protein